MCDSNCNNDARYLTSGICEISIRWFVLEAATSRHEVVASCKEIHAMDFSPWNSMIERVAIMRLISAIVAAVNAFDWGGLGALFCIDSERNPQLFGSGPPLLRCIALNTERAVKAWWSKKPCFHEPGTGFGNDLGSSFGWYGSYKKIVFLLVLAFHWFQKKSLEDHKQDRRELRLPLNQECGCRNVHEHCFWDW